MYHVSDNTIENFRVFFFFCKELFQILPTSSSFRFLVIERGVVWKNTIKICFAMSDISAYEVNLKNKCISHGHLYLAQVIC